LEAWRRSRSSLPLFLLSPLRFLSSTTTAGALAIIHLPSFSFFFFFFYIYTRLRGMKHSSTTTHTHTYTHVKIYTLPSRLAGRRRKQNCCFSRKITK
jgi:hypothetical protein